MTFDKQYLTVTCARGLMLAVKLKGGPGAAGGGGFSTEKALEMNMQSFGQAISALLP